MHRDADHHPAAYPAAHIGRRHILLSHMDAVRAARNGNLHIVVDEKGDPIAPAQGRNLHGLRQKRLLVQLFFPQLDTGSAAPQGGLHLLVQRLSSCPCPIGDCVEQHVPLIALHNLRLSPAASV